MWKDIPDIDDSLHNLTKKRWRNDKKINRSIK